ncbi:MAG TPA: bifunctional 4-hydroxy-2-oxoglutarate aldolase/2-dehydro-3-deoxy-phosphogluconate aldolase [Rhodothermales bacterium]
MPSNRQSIVESLLDAGAIAVIRMRQPERVLHVAQALLKGGVRALEITMTIPGALGCIETVANELSGELLLGVGSVVDAETAQHAIDAGAKYVISPIFQREVIEAAHRNDFPAIPGAFTPTEIYEAHAAGADMVKVFPADVVGMPFFKAVLAPMPFLRLIPTGGVSLTNAGDWLRAGAVAVGVGGALLDARAIAEGDYDKLTRNAEQLMASVRSGQAVVGG